MVQYTILNPLVHGIENQASYVFSYLQDTQAKTNCPANCLQVRSTPTPNYFPLTNILKTKRDQCFLPRAPVYEVLYAFEIVKTHSSSNPWSKSEAVLDSDISSKSEHGRVSKSTCKILLSQPRPWTETALKSSNRHIGETGCCSFWLHLYFQINEMLPYRPNTETSCKRTRTCPTGGN